MAHHHWDWEAAEVHGKTMQLLSNMSGKNEAACSHLMTGLHAVVAAKRAQNELLEPRK
jgi:hypothetical protein